MARYARGTHLQPEEYATRAHWHVHSTVGGGYLCNCDSHAPLTARERDAALRAERDWWRDYAADAPTVRITGSVRAGGFTIDDTASIAWARRVESWQCHEADCYAEDRDHA